MKTILGLILLLALGTGGYFAWKSRPATASGDGLEGRQTTAFVETRNIDFSVNVAGEIAPAEQVSVRPEINGRIASLKVDIGDKVKAGQLLFSLDDKELQNQRSSTVTDIDRTTLQLEQADRNFRRSQQLYADRLISLEQFEICRTDLYLASNALVRAQKELAGVDERLTKTKITAPFDCTVLTRPISVGQAVSGSGGVGGGTEVLSIADLNQMIINAHVNQADVTRLRVAQEVTIQVEAVAGLKVQGVVERIAPQATLKNSVKGFAARIKIVNPEGQIQPGMTANIAIPVASVENVLAVKLGAVFTETDPETGQMERYVFVKKGDSFERRPVQIGVSDYFYAEVLSGLAEGEVVALEVPPELQLQQQPAGGPPGSTPTRALTSRGAGTGVLSPPRGTKSGSPGPATAGANKKATPGT